MCLLGALALVVFASRLSFRIRRLRNHAPHLGLGLYIVRLIAEFHGGGAVALNRDEGDGVIVTVTLPIVSGVPAAPRAAG